MKVLRVLPYKGSMVYIRQFNQDIFTYDLVYNNEIYSSYMVFSPRRGQTKLSEAEAQKAASLLWAGAVATIEALLQKAPQDKKREVAETMVNVSNSVN